MVPAAIMSLSNDEDRDFLISIYLRLRKRLLAYARKLLDNEWNAEDAVQDAFVSLAPKITELRKMQDAHLEKYVFVTVKNAAFMKSNHDCSCREAERETVQRSDIREERQIYGYSMDDLMSAIQALSRKDRSLLEMKYFLGLSDQEISEKIGCKEISIRKLVSRARSRLVAEMEKESRS